MDCEFWWLLKFGCVQSLQFLKWICLEAASDLVLSEEYLFK